MAEGESIEVFSDHYLDSFDPDRKKGHKRRAADTNGQSGRNIPAEVQRKIRARARRNGVVCCEMPGCDNRRHLQYCHREWHAAGGSREYDNIWLGCTGHHAEYDGGLVDVRGPPDDLEFFFRYNGSWCRIKDPKG